MKPDIPAAVNKGLKVGVGSQRREAWESHKLPSEGRSGAWSLKVPELRNMIKINNEEF